MIMLFVIFSLSPLKAMVCNLDFNLLVCVIYLNFKWIFIGQKIEYKILNTRLTLIISYKWIFNGWKLNKHKIDNNNLMQMNI